MVDGSWTYSLIPKIPVGTCSSFKPWLGLWEICTGSREFDRKISGRPADLPLNQFCNLDGSGMIWISAAPCLALAQAGRGLGSPQVCSISQGHLPGYVCRLMPFLLSMSVTKPSREAWSTPLQPIASALTGRNSAVRRFQNLREARSTSLARSKFCILEGFKTCTKHVPPGPQTLPCSFSPLPALCQVEYCI